RKRLKPCAAYRETTCQRIGIPPISTSGFGISWLCSCRRVPRPPHRITTGTPPTPSSPPLSGDTLEHVRGHVEVGVHGAHVVEVFERVDQPHQLAGGVLLERD